MNRILVSNDVAFHYDIIESVINKYDYILNIQKNHDDIIDVYLVLDPKNLVSNNIYQNITNYLVKNYNVNIINKVSYSSYDYQIHCTVSGSDSPISDANIRPKDIITQKNIAYIAHDVTDELLNFDNVFFLSKFNRKDIPQERVLVVDKMPEVIRKKNKEMTIVVPGSFIRSKFDNIKDYSILEDMLQIDYGRNDFRIILLGAWGNDKFNLWKFINGDKIHRSNLKKIKPILNADWVSFNTICASSDYILPMISKEKQPDRFQSKITSSILYCYGYGVKMFVDQDFVDCYTLTNNQYEIYNRKSIIKDFQRILEKHYRL